MLSGSDFGVSPDSGHNLGSDRKAKLAVFSSDQERFLGRSREEVPDSCSGLIIGEFLDQKVSHQPLLRREVWSLRPHIFQKQFLSGIDSRRVQVIRAQPRLRWHWEVDDISERNFRRVRLGIPDSRAGLVLGDFFQRKRCLLYRSTDLRGCKVVSSAPSEHGSKIFCIIPKRQ